MAGENPRRYLLLLQVAKATPDRLAELVPALKSAVDALSGGENEMLFRSVQADVFGYLLTTKLGAAQIRAALESPMRGYILRKASDLPFLEGGDKVFVVELGTDVDAAQSFSRATTWLQHH